MLIRANPRFRKYNVEIDSDAYQAWTIQKTHGRSGDDIVPFTSTTQSSLTNTAGKCSPLLNVETTSVDDSAAVGKPALYPTTFSQIIELITAGKPIPGVKDIPDTILSGQQSQTIAAKRKKPWEVQSNEA